MSNRVGRERGDAVNRRRFVKLMVVGAVAVGLAGCADDGNDGLSPAAKAVGSATVDAGAAIANDPEVAAPADPEVTAPADPEVTAPADPEVTAPADPVVAAPSEVVIPQDAWEPANAETAFSPSLITVAVGTTITWQNTDTMIHTVTSGASDGVAGAPDGTFDSSVLQQDDSFEQMFAEAGTFDYFCAPHPWMIGQVVVTP